MTNSIKATFTHPGDQISISVSTKLEFSGERIANLLCCAFEGGSNYWYTIVGYQFADGIEYADFSEGGKFTDPDNYFHPCEIVPLHEGCAVLVSDGEDTVALDRALLASGLKALAEKYPHHFKNFMDDHEDADTGDVFLQCCLFGELVYG